MHLGLGLLCLPHLVDSLDPLLTPLLRLGLYLRKNLITRPQFHPLLPLFDVLELLLLSGKTPDRVSEGLLLIFALIGFVLVPQNAPDMILSLLVGLVFKGILLALHLRNHIYLFEGVFVRTLLKRLLTNLFYLPVNISFLMSLLDVHLRFLT
mmetsp:Transcript_23805/g.23493  ORF Transcript_23805/g.23493 Transcript_23805/m.23493 type:complete len:152 (+) Transcript_23805:813-1268(+)